jgi:hypothetical protein
MVPFVVSNLLGRYSNLKKYIKGTRFQFTLFNPSIFFRFFQNFLFFVSQFRKNRCAFYFFSFIKSFNFFFCNYFKRYSNIYFSSVPYPGFISNFNFLMLGSLKSFVGDPSSFLLGSHYSPVPQFSFNSSLIFLDFLKKSSFVLKELSGLSGPSFGLSSQKTNSSPFFYSLITDLFFKSYSIFYLLQLKDFLVDSSRVYQRKNVI